jgi:hypothetical protein
MQRTAERTLEAEDEELVGLLRWRFRQLCHGGFPPEEAVLLAARLDIDVHDAVELLDRGCPTATAARILL